MPTRPFPVAILTSAVAIVLTVSATTYYLYNNKKKHKRDDDAANNNGGSSSSSRSSRGMELSESDDDASDLTPKSKNTSASAVVDDDVDAAAPLQPSLHMHDDTAVATATILRQSDDNSIPPDTKNTKKNKKSRPKIKPISSLHVATAATSSSPITSELGFDEFAQTPPKSSLKKTTTSSRSNNRNSDEETLTPKEGADYKELKTYWKNQSTKHKFKAPEKSDAAIRVGSVSSASASTTMTTNSASCVDASLSLVNKTSGGGVRDDDATAEEEEGQKKSTEINDKETCSTLQHQPSKEDEDKDMGIDAEAEDAVESAAALPLGEKEDEDEEDVKKPTDEIQQQASYKKDEETTTIEEGVDRAFDEGLNTVGAMTEEKEAQTMTSNKDDTKNDREAPQSRPETTQQEVGVEEEGEDPQLIILAGSGSDTSGSGEGASRSDTSNEEGYVKIVRSPQGVPMSESEFLSGDNETKEVEKEVVKSAIVVEKEEQVSGGHENMNTRRPQYLTVDGEGEEDEKEEEVEKADKEEEINNFRGQGANTDASGTKSETEEGGRSPKKNSNKKKKKRKGKKK
jgi:hypothetical protein